MNKSFKIWFILLAIFSIFSTEKTNAQINPAQLKANWIFIIANNVTFPNNDSIDTIKIAIYGKNSPVYKFTKDLAEEKKIQNKPVQVKLVTRLSLIDGYNVVYLDESKNDFIEAVYNKIHNTGTLLITYRSEDQDHFMINLLLQDAKNQFQIQSSNLYDENITPNEKLMSLGGTRIDLQGLYEKKVHQLQEKEQQLRQKEQLLQEREVRLAELQNQVKEQQEKNAEQSKLIEEQTKELEEQKKNAQVLLEQVAAQEQLMKQNQFILANLNKEIQAKQNLIKEKNAELDAKEKEIELKQKELEEQQKRIDEQKEILKNKDLKIENQKNIITITIIFVIVFLMLSAIIWRSLRQNKKMNQELQAKNKEIEKQKNELKKQAEQLEEFNKELAKLSLVASKTDNSVIIMDKDSKFEWVNPGFTRIYGYTLQLLINEKGESLIEIAPTEKAKEEKRKLVDECITNKKTVVYQNKNKTRTGKEIWVQTALTPVLDENDEVTKLIAIESDITKLKEQEFEIKQKNEELHQQKAELQAQKDLLEEVNKQIKDSIKYAQTIQKAILPLEKDIADHFAHFTIFLPRDIVSGDFYWFVNPKENTYFIAAVDCTGHGVPGAFMSLISSRMLDELVTVQRICEPADILQSLNRMIIKALSQEDTNNRDGMDMALVKIERNNSDDVKVTFAGAKRPLIYYDKKQDKIITVKGNRRSIGGIRHSFTFRYEQEVLNLHRNDILYLSSDGMIDQNNHERKRFGTPRFLEMLEKVKDLPIAKQKYEILEIFNQFKKDEEQRDDITVIGIKL